jgi:microsomal dipeptidase-like Zn-dependent dipeptidase
MNQVRPGPVVPISDVTRDIHNRLTIMDWHADSTLWARDLTAKSDYGHVDIPRMLEGNVALQMFTTVTKVPKGLNYDSNSSEATDQITQLAMIQGWPLQTWSSLFERALYQASIVRETAKRSPNLSLVLNKSDLNRVLALRQQGQAVIGALIGTEGAHPLERSTLKVKELFDAGFRMVSLHHFFDNALGGSLHGESEQGLTDFGRAAVNELTKYGFIIDVSHSSHQVVRDVLAMDTKPLVVSHTGVYGHCPRKRNLPDELMLEIANQGGLIGIGYWEGAVCGESIEDIVAAMRYAIDLVGVEHVALGSDFDGAVTTPFDASGMVLLTDAMLKAGFTELEISHVMGANSVRYLQSYLPD